MLLQFFRVRWYQANARRALARFTGLRIDMVNMGVGVMLVRRYGM